MKHLLFILLFLFAVPFVGELYAQNQTGPSAPEYPLQKNAESEQMTDDTTKTWTPEQRAERQSNVLQKKLGLTEQQKTAVYNLSLNRINKISAVREKYKTNSDKTGARTDYIKIKSDYDSALNDVLDDDQKKTLAQLKADAKAKREEYRKKHPKSTPRQPAEQDPEIDY